MQDPRWYAPPAAGLEMGTPSAASEMMLEPGGFAIRAGAHLLDMVLCLVVALVAGVMGGITVAVLAGAGVVSADWAQRINKTDALTFLLGLLAALLYHTIAEALGGATAGKAILGLRVLTERREPCTLLKSLGRNLAYYFDTLFFGLVGWSAMSKSAMRQRYGDRWAGTIVIRTRSAHGMTMRSPVVGILVGFFAYGALQFVALVIKAF